MARIPLLRRATVSGWPKPLATSLLASALMCLSLPPPGVAADANPPAQKLTATQIVDKFVAARGGQQAWHAVRAISWNGKLEAGAGDSAARSARFVKSARVPTSKKDLTNAPPAAETDTQVQLPFVLTMERPRKSRVELQFAGKTAVQVYDGAQGWKIRPFLNRSDVEPFTAEELKSQQDRGELDGPLFDYAAKGTRVDLEGTEEVDGHAAYKLKLTLKDATVQHVWIDTHSFLDVKVEGSPRRMDGRVRPVWVYQRDFRLVQGLMVPFVLETAVDGYRDTHKMFIEKVVVNPKLSDASFTRPGGA